jgi:glycerophosphoryl diester phosphodiesterase
MPKNENRQDRRMITVLLSVLSVPLVLFAITMIGGALSPREHRAEASAHIDATDAQVYAAITDVSAFVEWRSGLEGVELLRGAGHRQWRERSDGEQVTYEIVEEDPPRRLVTSIAGEGLPWGGTWTYEVTAEGEGVRVTLVEEGWVDNLVLRFFTRFVRGYEANVTDYLSDLSAYAPRVETTAAPIAMAPRLLDVQGHRGARGLSPENTLAGFRRALAVGVTTLEMDLGMTADDVVVVHHDETLNPDTTRGPDGAFIDASRALVLRSLLAEDLATYDVGRLRPGSRYAARFPDQEAHDGARIPALVEVLALADEVSGRTIRYNLELKRTPALPERTADPETFARAVLAVVDAAGVRDRTTFQSFDLACIDALAALANGLTLSCLTTSEEEPGPWLGGRDVESFGGSVVRLVESTACTIWSPRFEDLEPTALAEARAAGLRVVPWTLNDPDAIARAYDMGVDGIISDYPNRVRALLEQRGAPVPPLFPER